MTCHDGELRDLIPAVQSLVAALEALLSSLQKESDRRLSRTELLRYRTVPEQVAFHAAGADHRERLLMAGTSSGRLTAARQRQRST